MSLAPHVFYSDFPGYSLFLTGKKEISKYTTWTEAGSTAVKMDIRTITEYSKRAKKDPRLPGSPASFYADFPGWKKSLGKENPVFYRTLRQVRQSCRKLGIRTCIEYSRRYKEDSHLPSTPGNRYPGFPGWKKFLREWCLLWHAAGGSCSIGADWHFAFLYDYLVTVRWTFSEFLGTLRTQTGERRTLAEVIPGKDFKYDSIWTCFLPSRSARIFCSSTLV